MATTSTKRTHALVWRMALLLVTGLPMLSGCAQETSNNGEAKATELPTAVIYKNPSCSCCAKWGEHLAANGFTVEMRDTQRLASIKDAHEVPADMRSCHTAEIGGYVVEGHVPAADIHRLLREQPDARGLAVPAMPLGSPGMEVDDRRQAYTVWLLGDSEPTAFSSYAARNLE